MLDEMEECRVGRRGGGPLIGNGSKCVIMHQITWRAPVYRMQQSIFIHTVHTVVSSCSAIRPSARRAPVPPPPLALTRDWPSVHLLLM
jgi:hypothetical protein